MTEHSPWYLDPDGPYCYACMADDIAGPKVLWPCTKANADTATADGDRRQAGTAPEVFPLSGDS